MWIDDDLIFPIEKTFGQMYEDGYRLPVDYLFYDERYRAEFEKKFYKHFKYNRIAFDSEEMFSDMFQDILDVNYPKYKHYYDTLEKAKTLKWWNNKDFVTEFTRQLDKQEGTTFLSTLEKLDKMTKTLEKKGDVTDAYARELKENTVEKGKNNITNDLKKTGENTKTVNKGTTVETDFTRNLNTVETQANTDSRKDNRVSTNESTNRNSNNSSSEDISNTTTKNLDTPQGTINNLIDNVNAYMTTATVDSSKDLNKTTATSNGYSDGKSEDITLTSSTENKDIKGYETGTTKNTELTHGIDETTDQINEKNVTLVEDIKDNTVTLDKTGSATDVKKYNTTDTTTRIVTDTDTTNSNEEMTGQDNETYTKKEEGNIGVTSAGQLVNDWIKFGYINLDKMIIWDCEKLFLQVY